MKIIKTSVIVLTAALLLGACTSNEDDVQEVIKNNGVEFKENLSITEASFYPEGIDYDHTNNLFVVGSFYKGEVAKLNPTTGELKTFINDKDLIAVTGVYTDELRNRLIVAIADAGASLKSTSVTRGVTAKVAIYNLTTGEKEALISLESLTTGTGNFANDIAVDDKGNIYVTNSFGNADIYKIDINNKASLFYTITGAETTNNNFGLNGIVFYAPTKQLIISHTTNDYMYTLTLGESPIIETFDSPLSFIDGLEIDEQGKLIQIGNSNDDIAVSTIIVKNKKIENLHVEYERATKTESFRTTATSVKGKGTFILESHLTKLFNNNKTFNKFKIVELSNL
ncbi:SMP-30/gluconolactonase/LRE family protein [Tenacibaculum ovolyticum]|uniref:SMP-30/gluconolactonase/LRE family protein n=1 Tax=Tenacibaculum ovolyticum TaxID=104270 RepID=UPI0007ECEFA3|nr:SMP-30/gluconolactonase/LRE family protein [Tenacibaculum ovolyticum]